MLGGTVAHGQCTVDAGQATIEICAGGPLQLNAVAGGGQAPYSYSWTPITGLNNPNIANPVSTTTGPITYTVQITDDAGCTASDAIAVTVIPAADAVITSNTAFTVFNGVPTFYRCISNPTANFQFEFGGSAQPGSTHTINWGDGSPADVFTGTTWPGQTRAYPQGIHTITYTITQTNGCNDTQVYRVFVGTNPAGALVNPGSTTGCGPITLTFPIVGWSTNTPGTIYTVTFNDGTPPVVYTHPPPASITHTFNVGSCGTTSTDGVNTYPNSFSANMLVENPCGTSGSTVLPIVVSLAGQANFNISPNDTACVATTVTFSSTSTGNEVLGSSCDVTPALLWSITPAVGWSIASGSLGNDNGFGVGNYDPGSWSSGSATLGINFSVAGVYDVRLIAGNACGGDTLLRSICIEPPPVPSFTLAQNVVCAPFNLQPDNTSTNLAGCLLTHEWTLSGTASACATGPASTGSSTLFEPSFTLSQPGTYTLQLRERNSCNVPPVSQTITVNAPPQVQVAPLSGICAGQCVTPSATVVDCGAPVSLSWNFPGGSPATANTLAPGAICFAAAGSPTVSLTATNACGSATSNANLAIGTAPVTPIASSNSPVCQGQTISLTAMGAPGVTYIWRDPAGNIIANAPAHTIPNAAASNAGTYTVVTVSNGCESAPASVTVTITPAPVVTVSPTSAAVCNGQSATFTASGAGNYQWFINSTLVGTGPTITTSPAVTTTYTVSGNIGGCPGSATVTVTVFQPTPLTMPAPPTFCDQAIPVNLPAALPTGGSWSGPNVTTAGVFTPTPGGIGVVNLTYTYVNANGCTSTGTLPVNVQVVPAFANAGNDTSFCQDALPVDLFEAPPGGTWVGAGPGGSYVPSTVGGFTLTYTFGTGSCLTSDNVNVQVVPATSLTLPPDIERCIDGAVVALSGNPTGGAWSGAGVSGPPWNFDPAVAGVGDHTLTYTFVNASNCESQETLQATVHALPVVNAGSDITLCDQPIAYQLGGDPVGGTWSSTWLPIAPDNSVTPNGVGTDQLTYTFTDANGCTNSASIQLEIVPVDVPAFAGVDTAVCVNSGTLALVGTPAGGTWTGAMVALDGSFDPSVPGVYPLTYSVGSGTCLLVDQVVVVVNPLPGLSTAGDQAFCVDAGVQQLIATPEGGTWAGMGVDPVTGVFDPAAAGVSTHPVTYTYIDPLTGCSNTTGFDVVVNELPVAALVHDPVFCANVPAVITNLSTPGTSAEWTFGDGGVSTAFTGLHSYTATGTYNVQLVAINGAGCSDTISTVVEVYDVPEAVPVLSTEEGCGPLTVSFGNASVGDGLGYSWELGGLGTVVDAVPADITFPVDVADAVVYPVTLTATNTCGSDAVTVPVTVLPAPTAIFGPNVDLHCAYAPVPFGNASIGLPDSFEWDFGDGGTSTSNAPEVTHVYEIDAPTITSYTVTLIATNSCGSDTATQVVDIQANQVNAFFNTDPVVGCGPLTVDLTDFSVGDTARFWEFGDGNSSILENPSHTYTEAGTWTITLYAYGCGFDSYSTEVTVLPFPTVDFTYTPAAACAGVPYTFTSTTTGNNGLQWDLGDGTTSTLNSVSHAYANGGNFTVTLTATDAVSGCSASDTQVIQVNTSPVAAFTPNPGDGCVDLAVQLQNTSTNAQFYQWDLGDGNSTTGFAPAHTYTSPGTYTVTLIAENVNGCSDSQQASVVVHPLPSASFTLSQTSSCEAPVDVQLSNTSSGAQSFAWDLGNGTTTAVNQPLATYTEVGSYTISLTATNQYGCTDDAVATFVVHPTPEASFTATPQPGCEGYPIAFTNTSINASTYRWRFGDGSQSTAEDPVHSYAQAGIYNVLLIANGAGGCADTLNAFGSMVVNPTPTAAFSTDTLASVRNALRFQNVSTGAVSYWWDFGDGTVDEEEAPIHVFPADGGTYLVTLIAYNSFGCPDTVRSFVGAGADPMIFVPNAFTPNNDGRNEVFMPVLNGFNGWNYTLLVFDRWGKVVFESRDRNVGWDGRVKGREPLIDTYVWRVLVERDGDARDFTGHVTLLD
jgi:gliding motility-associated-like protein